MPATDQAELEQLLAARHPCVSILTFEEDHALDVVREIAVGRGCDMWLWSVSCGIRDGLVKNPPCVADTENAFSREHTQWVARKDA